MTELTNHCIKPEPSSGNEVECNGLLAQSILLRKMRVKKATRILNSLVLENFGYAPNSANFHYILNIRCIDLNYLRVHSHDWYKKFEYWELKEKGHLLPTYLS